MWAVPPNAVTGLQLTACAALHRGHHGVQLFPRAGQDATEGAGPPAVVPASLVQGAAAKRLDPMGSTLLRLTACTNTVPQNLYLGEVLAHWLHPGAEETGGSAQVLGSVLTLSAPRR